MKPYCYVRIAAIIVSWETKRGQVSIQKVLTP